MENERNEKIDGSILDIEATRRKNNENWMEVLRLAIQYAPRKKLVKVLQGIERCDTEIKSCFSSMLDELKKGGENE